MRTVSISLLEKYQLDWKSISLNGFNAEVFHIARNAHGGTLQVRIAQVSGFRDSLFGAHNKPPTHWTVCIFIRTDVKHNDTIHRRFISNHALRRLAYRLQSLQDRLYPNFKVDDKLVPEIKRILIEKNVCTEPLILRVLKGSIESEALFGEIIRHPDLS